MSQGVKTVQKVVEQILSSLLSIATSLTCFSAVAEAVKHSNFSLCSA